MKVTIRSLSTLLISIFFSATSHATLLGDFVWNDSNRNGIQDSTEAGIAGVTVNLFKGDVVGSGISAASTTTDASGNYSFLIEEQDFGPFYLGINIPTNFFVTALRAGSDPTVDSDIDSSGVTRVVEIGETDILDLDMGLFELAAIDIRKQEEGPDSRTFSSGETAAFEISVTNIGSIDLTSVIVTDPLFTDLDRIIGNLAVGQSVTYAGSDIVTSSFINEACVSGEGVGIQVSVSDCDTSEVVVANIPEPTTLALIGLGLAGIGYCRHRQIKTA